MVTDEDDWHLFAWESYDEATTSHVTPHIRPATGDDVEALAGASALLNALMSYGPYADYIHATDAMHDAITALEDAWATSRGSEPHRELRTVHAAVKTWLAAVRSFDDRTSSWLSTQFGKDGTVYQAFKSELRAEYDRNFAYRMSYNLRNASEHASAVLNHVQVNAREERDGSNTHRVDLGFHAPRLAERFPKLKAAIRVELRAYDGMLGLEAVVGHATTTVERSWAAMLLAALPDVERALRLVEALHAEAEAVGGQAAHYATVPGPQGGKMHVRRVEIHVARSVRDNAAVARFLMDLPASDTTATDLAL